VVRKIPAECKDAFEAAVGALRKLGKIDVAIEAVVKVILSRLLAVRVLHVHARAQSGDVRLLCELYVECGKWQEAFKVADSNPELLKMVHAQHAAHLVHHDRFEDAMQVLAAISASMASLPPLQSSLSTCRSP
jgi:hypothetical protein